MKINKNVVLEYLYLTIFVITLFVLKELIEYVFFTRKRNNIIEKFSDPDTCGRIEWYYENHENIKKIFEIFRFNGDVLEYMNIDCQEYVEFKTVETDLGSRTVLVPKNNAIHFEHFTWSGQLAADATNSPSIVTNRCVVIKVHNVPGSPDNKNYLDFVSYTYDTATYKVPFYSDNTSTFQPPSDTTRYTIFARFDIDTPFNQELNVKINELLATH